MEKAILSGETLLATSRSHHRPKSLKQRHRSYVWTRRDLMHRALRSHARIELDLSEGTLVTGHVLLQKSQ